MTSSTPPNQSWFYYFRRGFTDLWFILLMFTALALIAILLGYHRGDPGWSTSGVVQEPHHWLGGIGAYIADSFLSILGYASYAFAVGLAVVGWQSACHARFDAEMMGWHIFALIVTVVSLSGIFSLHWPVEINSLAVTAGGLFGQKMSIELLRLWPVHVVMLIYTIPLVVGLTILFNVSWLSITQRLGLLLVGLFFQISAMLKGEDKQPIDAIIDNTGDPQVRRQELRQRLDPKADIEPTLNWQDYKKGNIRKNDYTVDFSEESKHGLGATALASAADRKACEDQQTTQPAHNSGAFYFDDDVSEITNEQSTMDNVLFDDFNAFAEQPHTNKNASSVHYQQHNNDRQDVKHDEPSIDFGVFNDDDYAFLDEPPFGAASYASDIYQSEHDTPQSESIRAKASILEYAETPDSNSVVSNESPSTLKVKLPINSGLQSVQHASEKSQNTYQLPPLDLLKPSPDSETDYTDEELDEMAAQVENALLNYKLDVKVANIELGPVVTRLELDLAPGIKVSQISNLDKDLARSLAVQSVRIVDVIPGKPYIGLEIPNRKRDIVYLREVLESSAYTAQKSPLTIVLGVDIAGKPIIANLGKMPHLLVAGTTGSGKSVGINVMLASMLYKSTPKQLKLILVDPKMLEMSMYEDIPHLLTPVVTDMNDAENALRWAVAEMERRYQLMSAFKVRNIDAFNKVLEDNKARGEHTFDPLWNPEDHLGLANQPPELELLPYIVIVIDELADMMMAVGKKVEELIARIAQKARAAGIHLILATQRPSVDVITGLIKANVPTRIAFQVSSKIDSRTIIERHGAESLLGHGDMLYAPPGLPAPLRVHGAFIDDGEVDRLTSFVKSQGEPDYEDAITNPVSSSEMGAFGAAEKSDNPEDDPLYDQAVALVAEHQKASISWLQRQLSIGYNRSAKIVEAMEAVGIVSSPERGTRRVLISKPDSSGDDFY